MNFTSKTADNEAITAAIAEQDSGNAKKSDYDHVDTACAFIQENYRRDINVKDIAAHAAIDRTYLYRLFCKYKGMSPSNYLRLVRLDRTMDLILKNGLTIKEASRLTGFRDLSHFYRVFKAVYGIAPKKYIAAVKTSGNNDL